MAKNLVNGTATAIEENGDNISIQINFPIGYIYMSTSPTNPSTYFGGTWQRIAKGRTLVGVDENDTDFASAELTGGSKELQEHSHTVPLVSVISPQGGGTDPNYAVIAKNSTQNSGSTGTGNSGNLQPYFTCYIWEKVGA